MEIWRFEPGNLWRPLCLTGEGLGTARPHSFTAQNGLDGEQLSNHHKADEIGLVGVWRFDLGNLMAHGCGKGKIAATKSRWDKISGDSTIWSGTCNGTRCVSPLCLSGEALGSARPCSKGKLLTIKSRWDIGLVGIWRFDLGNLMAHGCSKGKIVTTKSRWRRTCGDLTWEI